MTLGDSKSKALKDCSVRNNAYITEEVCYSTDVRDCILPVDWFYFKALCTAFSFVSARV